MSLSMLNSVVSNLKQFEQSYDIKNRFHKKFRIDKSAKLANKRTSIFDRTAPLQFTNPLTVKQTSQHFNKETISIDLVMFSILSFLDGRSLGFVQQLSRSWRNGVLTHENQLYSHLLQREFHISTSTISNFHEMYLSQIIHQSEKELKHIENVARPYAAVEEYCINFPEDHGIIGMLADLCFFDDDDIAKVVGRRRYGALSMVIVESPAHVENFRRRTEYIGPLTFVPLDNPYWPDVQLVQLIQAEGFLGYAFDLVHPLPGFEFIKTTVIKAIFKDLMVFHSHDQAELYTQKVQQSILATAESEEQANLLLRTHGSVYHVALDRYDEEESTQYGEMCFSTKIRRELQSLRLEDRKEIVSNKMKSAQDSLGYLLYGR